MGLEMVFLYNRAIFYENKGFTKTAVAQLTGPTTPEIQLLCVCLDLANWNLSCFGPKVLSIN